MAIAHRAFRLPLASSWLCTFISIFDMMGGWAGQNFLFLAVGKETIQLACRALLGS